MPNMQISTLSVMAGTTACNRKCPYCISKTTYQVNKPTRTKIPPERIAFLVDKFLRVCSGLPYGIITGKGEPTLMPKEELGEIVEILHADGKGLIPELQTNGLKLTREYMQYLKDKGLNTVAISCVSMFDEINSKILGGGDFPDGFTNVVKNARDIGLLVRLTATITKGGIDSPDSLLAFLLWAKEAGAHQITFREMGKPRNLALPGSEAVAQWIDSNFLPTKQILSFLPETAQEKESLPWARKFGFEGMSVVVTECLTPPKDGVIRSAIIQPDGHMYASWDDPADILF